MVSLSVSRRAPTSARIRRRRRPWSDRARDLGRHPATWLSVICALPIVIAAFRTISGGWVPEGDDARLTTRIRAVLTGNLPLQGMRSTSGNTDRQLDTHHPGPLQFYVDAPVSALFHYSAAGIVLSVVLVNVACVIGIIVLAQRMRGLRTAVPVAGGLLLAEWQLGPDPLSHPLNPYAGILSVFLMIVAAWAVLDRDPHGPWVMLLSGSFAAQCDLAFCPLVLAVCALALAVCAARVWRNVRRHHAGRSWRSRAAARKRTLITFGLTLLVWLPSLIELVAVTPNNVQLLGRFVTSAHPEGQQAVGMPSGTGFVIGHLSPTTLARFSSFMNTAPSRTGIGIGLVVLLLLLLAATAGPRLPRTAATRGCWVVLVAIIGESVAMSRTDTATQRTAWELPVLLISGLAYAVLLVRTIELLRTASTLDRITAATERLAARFASARLAPASIAAGMAIGLVAALTAHAPDLAPAKRTHSVTTAVLRYLDTHARRGAPVSVVSAGLGSWITVAPGVGFQLLRQGYQAHFEIDWSYPEDIDRWNLSTAPPGSVVVTIVDDSALAKLKLPDGSVSIPLDPRTAPATHAWIAIPAARSK